MILTSTVFRCLWCATCIISNYNNICVEPIILLPKVPPRVDVIKIFVLDPDPAAVERDSIQPDSGDSLCS